MTMSTVTTKVDVACQRPGEDVTQVDDGPLFRATMKSMEHRTGSMRARWKKVLRRAETAVEAQATVNDSMAGLMEALRDASSSNSNAVQPAIEHYFDKIAKEILGYEKQNAINLQKMIIEPSACETKSLPLSQDTINDLEPSSPAVRNSLLLAEALTHPSLGHETHRHHFDNQRLEFLGDAVLQLIITDHLYALFPRIDRGPCSVLNFGLDYHRWCVERFAQLAKELEE